MTPAEQIHLETTTLEKQIHDLIEGFEKRTGVCVQKVSSATFQFNAHRASGEPFEISVFVELPLLKPKQV